MQPLFHIFLKTHENITFKLVSLYCWAHPLPLLFPCCWLESIQTHKHAEYYGFHHICGQGTSAALVDSDPRLLLAQDSSGIVCKLHSHIEECAASMFVSVLKRIEYFRNVKHRRYTYKLHKYFLFSSNFEIRKIFISSTGWKLVKELFRIYIISIIALLKTELCAFRHR